ncbi:MAG: cobalamin-binding protein [Pseudomonadota bacterium]
MPVKPEPFLSALIASVFCFLLLAPAPRPLLVAPVCASMADETRLCLERPAERVVSLTPHLTEMLHAIGAQDRIAGVVEHSDYPPEAARHPLVGPFHAPDLERLLSLRPDLVVSWRTGSPAALIERLRKLGLPVWIARSERLDDIPAELRALGGLTGQDSAAGQAARDYESALSGLRAEYANRRPLRGFYEIWAHPLITVSDRHFIGEAMHLCGIENIVGSASSATPTWNEEAVIRARPELLLTSPPARDFQRWRRWPELPAVRNDALFILPPDVLMRPGPRLIEGVRALCSSADRARSARP